MGHKEISRSVIQRESEVEQNFGLNHSKRDKGDKNFPRDKDRKQFKAKAPDESGNAFAFPAAFPAKEKEGAESTMAFGGSQPRHVNKRRERPAMKPREKQREKYCSLCLGGGHWTAECKKYPNLKTRLKKAKELGLCLRCLKKGHSSRECEYIFRPCFFCKNKSHLNALCSQKFGLSVQMALTIEVVDYESEPEEEEEKEKEQGEEETTTDDDNLSEDTEEESERQVAGGTKFKQNDQFRTKRLFLVAMGEIFNPNDERYKKKVALFLDQGC